MELDIDSYPAAKRKELYSYIRFMEEKGIPEEDTIKVLTGEMTLGFAFGKKLARKAVQNGFYKDIRWYLSNASALMPHVEEGIYYFAECWKTATGEDILKLAYR